MSRWHDAWYRGQPIFWLLLPLSVLFLVVTALRRWAYVRGFIKSYRAPVPVIVVGNITVGGTGKTPLVLALVERLRDAGYQPGIVSRGYGGISSTYPRLVDAQDEASEVGDEPLLLTQRAQVPVVIDPLRSRGVQALLAQTACDVVICDDGLQHLALQRDIEIVVIDGARGFGSGLPLPAGPLRELPSRLKTVDFCVSNGDFNAGASATINPYVMRLEADTWQPVNTEAAVAVIGLNPPVPGSAVHAVAGIGHPQRFFNMLHEQGFMVTGHAFADHHAYSEADLAFDATEALVMTEKDAVKCRHMALNNAWYVPVKAQLSDFFWQQVLARLALEKNALC
ncbi:MAG: tetraacyldisaccharide 4'-kinase [Moraxellaceae bacterium]|nr:tetraacyldisaccharide 4'-kinase [Moraxellaceae bacterium]MDZ4387498.1 tetraacyldisaccharide 4'-kinase [Moraxellaceae bacterium]